MAIASYAGAAKETLTTIADQLSVSTMTDDERPNHDSWTALRWRQEKSDSYHVSSSERGEELMMNR